MPEVETANDRPLPRRLVRAEQVLARRTRRVSVLLEGVQDPHNVHAVLRTAEALGIQDVHLVGVRGEAAAITPGVTQGAHDWLTIRRHADVDEAVATLREEGREIWAADNAVEAESLTGISVVRPVALVLGSEADGLSDRARELADRLFRIDLVGFTGSLNLSVAAAIALWELRREEVLPGRDGDLPNGDRQALRATWFEKLLGRRAGRGGVESWLARANELREAAEASTRVTPRARTRAGS